MNPKAFLITSAIIVALISITAGTFLGLRARRARTVPPAESLQAVVPSLSDNSYLPSREYIEARVKAFKQVREEQLKAQFSNVNENMRK